jgi:hypothetical protein
MFSKLRRRWQQSKSRPRAGRRPGLAVEPLEERWMPTVAFTPVYGEEGVLKVGDGVMKVADVYPILWGSFWSENPGKAQAVSDKLKAVVQVGNYLSGLKQYGSNGIAIVHSAVIDDLTDPNDISTGPFGSVSGEVNHAVYDQDLGITKPTDSKHQAIYAVFTGPTVGGSKAGFNQPSIHPDLFSPDIREEIWVGTGAGKADSNFNMDRTTSVFSHELVEAMSDMWGIIPNLGGIECLPGALWPKGLDLGELQLADNEPDGTYAFRLGGPSGPLTQAYWSASDKQFIVPDGNQLKMQIKPAAFVAGNFVGGELAINATQKKPVGFSGPQDITIDTTSIGGGKGIRVVMDGETFVFEPGQITSITVNGGDDAENITINGAPQMKFGKETKDVPITLNLGSGKYTLTLSPHGAANALQSPITVNTLGGADLTVKLPTMYDQDDFQSPVVIHGVDTGSLTFKMSYQPRWDHQFITPDTGVIPFDQTNVEYIGFYDVMLRADGFPPDALTLHNYGATISFEFATISGPGSGLIYHDGGFLDYSGFSTINDLGRANHAGYSFTGKNLIGNTQPPVDVVDGPTVDDQVTTSLKQSFIGFGGSVTDPVNFANKADVTLRGEVKDGSFTVDLTKPSQSLTTLTIDPGSGTTTVGLKRTPQQVHTTVLHGAGNGLETVTLHAPGQGVQGILGEVDVQNTIAKPSAFTLLVVDDTDNTNSRTAFLNDTSLAGLAPATISWEGVTVLGVNGGSGGNTFVISSKGHSPVTVVNTGDGNDTVVVGIAKVSNYNLWLYGGPGTNALYVNRLDPTILLDQNPGLIVAYTGSRLPTSTIHYEDFAHVGIDEVSRGGTIVGTDAGGTGSRATSPATSLEQSLEILDAYFGLEPDRFDALFSLTMWG